MEEVGGGGNQIGQNTSVRIVLAGAKRSSTPHARLMARAHCTRALALILLLHHPLPSPATNSDPKLYYARLLTS